MKAILTALNDNLSANILWSSPFIFGDDVLEDGFQFLTELGYQVEDLEDSKGLVVSGKDSEPQQLVKDIEAAFHWIDFTKSVEVNLATNLQAIQEYAIVAMPITRLEVNESILSEKYCLLPAGILMLPELFNDNDPLPDDPRLNPLRKLVTELTGIDRSVFTNLPLVVFDKKISEEEYLRIDQPGDVDLIMDCSREVEPLFDLLRFFRAYGFSKPEFLPAKAGIWNDRYSAMLIYFPASQRYFIQSREVEARTFVKGIGLDIHYGQKDLIGLCPLLYRQTNEIHDLTKHALRLFSSIMEADDESMKFTLCMILFEFLGDPFAYRQFKQTKKQFLPPLVRDAQHYQQLLSDFENYSTQIRTPLVHQGKILEDVIPSKKDRDQLFYTLHQHLYNLVHYMLLSTATTWQEFVDGRELLKKKYIQ